MKNMITKKKIVLIVITTLLTLSAVCCLAAERAYMGIYTSEWSMKKNASAKDYNYGITIVDVVKDGPAQEAGVKTNDLLLMFDNEKVYTKDQLTKMLQNYEPGDKVKITVLRTNGDEKTLKIKLGKKEDIFKTPKRAFLGVYLEDLDEDDYEELELEGRYGIEIEKIVDDSPAEKAGMEEDDIILELDGDRIYTESQFSQMLKNFKPEDKVTLTILRDDDEMEVEVVLGEHDYMMDILGKDFKMPESVFMYKYKKEADKGLGVSVKTLVAESLDKSPVEKGVEILKIYPGTPAEEADLQVGDIITKIDEEEVEQVEDLKDVINDKEIDESVKLQIVRGKNLITKVVKIAELPEAARKMNKVKVFLDDGEVKMEINGEESTLLELEKIFQSLENLKNLKELKKMEEIEALEDLELDEEEKELKIKILSKEKGMI